MHNDGCPFCETVKKVLIALDVNTSHGVRFEILHSVMGECKEAGYTEGYADALIGQMDYMSSILDDVLDDTCDCDDCTDDRN